MAITIQTSTDGPPKRQLIELAFGDIGSAGYEFGRTAEEVSDALSRLNVFMLEWPWNRLNYQQPTYGLGSPDDYSGIPWEATNAVASMLALRLAPVMGATLPPEAKANLLKAMSSVYALTATINTMPLQAHTPRGMGSEHNSGIGFISPFAEEDFDDVNTAPLPLGTPGAVTGDGDDDD